MPARHRELLKQLAEEHERLLQELEGLRAQLPRAPLAACAQDDVDLGSASGPPLVVASGAPKTLDGPQRSVSPSGSYQLPAHTLAGDRRGAKAVVLDDGEDEGSDLALCSAWATPPPDDPPPDDVLKGTPSGFSGRSRMQRYATRIYEAVRASAARTESVPSNASSCLQSCVMSPTSMKRQAWDLLCMVVLAYDVCVLPLFVFRDEDSLTVQFLYICTTLVWTLDVFMSFFTGYYDVGNVEMSISKIAWRYVRTWFMLDFPVLLIDWFTTLLLPLSVAQLLSIARVSKIFRLVRCLRMLRLVRLLKFRSGNTTAFDSYLRSESLVTFWTVLRSLGYILAISHYIACGWYFIGGQQRPFTWVQILDDEDRDVYYRYITALHWSVTQFTPASAEVQPKNFQERVCAVLVILAGMVGFSTFVSSITQAMARLHHARRAELEQHARMRRFFIENQISFDVGNRINIFLKERNFNRQSRTFESDVASFAILPEGLRRELHAEMYRPVAATHYFLHHALHLDQGFAEELCHHAMSEFSVERAGELFGPPHGASEAAFHVRSGVGDYVRRGGQALAAMRLAGKWLCEVALWLEWRPRGSIVATSMLECVALDAPAFRKLASSKAILLLVCARYAREYRSHLIAAEDRETSAELGFNMEVQEQMVSAAFSDSDVFARSETFSSYVRVSSPLARLGPRAFRRAVQ